MAAVVQALVEEVERSNGERPLRRTVGQDVLEPVTAINEACRQVQAGLIEHYSLK